jgi:hypothetical protein
MTDKTRTNQYYDCFRESLIWYILFGILHEGFHIGCAILYLDGSKTLSKIVSHDGFVSFLIRLVLERCTILPYNDEDDTLTTNHRESITTFAIIRHAGWIGSILVALMVTRFLPSNPKWFPLKQAACLTALEAILTDLFSWSARFIMNDRSSEEVSIQSDDDSIIRTAIFYCGNVGIIVLHHLWFANQGQAALDVLQKMIQITMMRGAQSGGVVTFQHTYDHHKKNRKHKIVSSKGIRSRCVNLKRTDLSHLVRNKVKQDVFPWWRFWNTNPFPAGSVTVLSGHTRFATSSKASMDGTHPHQWTPSSLRRVYDFNSEENSLPTVINVENFITVRSNPFFSFDSYFSFYLTTSF